MPTTLLYMDIVRALVDIFLYYYIIIIFLYYYISYFYGDSANSYICGMNDYPCMERPVQMSTIKALEHCSSYYCWLWNGICTQDSTAF